jgi:CHAD domain-containing protein
MEIEAKFAVPDDSSFETLLSLESLGDYRLVPSGEQRMTDRYVDTPGRDLLQSGHTCRRRVGQAGGPELVTVKGLGGALGAVHRRFEQEMEVPLDAPPEQWPSGAPRDIVLQLTRGKPLVEFLTLHQHRTTRSVTRRDQRIATISLDRVEFAGGATACEMEIELSPPGSGADLEALGQLLRPFGLRPQSLSKFERALSLVEGATPVMSGASQRIERHPVGASFSLEVAASSSPKPNSRAKPVGVRASDPMAEAGRKILHYHWNQALGHEAGTKSGVDPEELHDMRVATRRQRAALRIVEAHFRRKALRPLREGLRALGGRLGEVRDLDVLLAAARDHQAAVTATEAVAFQSLVDDWMRQREAARIRMVEYLGGETHAVFKERYTAFLDTPGAGARAEPAPRPTLVAHVLPYEIWAHYGALVSFDRALLGASYGTLHAVRIQGKRLRYLLEFFREVLDPCVEKPIKAIVALQDHLGELQDCVVTIALVNDFLAGNGAHVHREVAAATSRYRELRQARIAELRRTLDRPWDGVTNAAFRIGLSQAASGAEGK